MYTWIKDKHYRIKPSGCWEWAGVLDRHGYGKTTNNQSTHRRAWEQTHGPIPLGMCVCHSCDNPKCINPDHLWLGTHAENNKDMVQKHRFNPLGNAKLNACKVGKIRKLVSLGYSQASVARHFGVSGATIHNILVGKSWNRV